jgi:hypothetical protein
MLDLGPWSEIIRSLGPGHAGIVLILLSLLLALENRRFGSLVLLAQYTLFSLLLAPHLYQLVVLARMALALGICSILYITASRVQRHIATHRATSLSLGSASPVAEPTTVRTTRKTVRAFFNLPALALGGLLAYSVWRAYPMSLVPPTFSLASYWVIGIGLVTALVSGDPLRRGLGLLMIVSGCESLYLSVEQGLLVIGLLSIIDVMLALAIVYTAEIWLEASPREENAS